MLEFFTIYQEMKKIRALSRTTFKESRCSIKNSQKVVRSLVLLSGGLDSILAAKILMEQGIEVVGLTFKSYFFGAEQAEKAAKDLGILLKIVDFSKEHLEVVKNPKYGYGSSINPCLDCHILMLRKAKEIVKKEGFDFVATGEVLGERPMSQNRQALELVEKESSLKGFLLRPLSAKLLSKSVPEGRGWVNREEFFDISGRSRKKQMAQAKKWGIKDYPAPAGGCILTDLEFGKKLRELLKRHPQAQGNDIELLKVGRHFWFPHHSSGEGRLDSVKIVVGRNHEENIKLEELAQRGNLLIRLESIAGPTTLIKSYGKKGISEEALERAKAKTQYYSTKARSKKEVKFIIKK